jgi:hypothetical protein
MTHQRETQTGKRTREQANVTFFSRDHNQIYEPQEQHVNRGYGR